MRKKKKKAPGPPKDGWLVTFSDLMTLLLTFFVLLLTMSTMNVQKLREITIKNNKDGPNAIQRGKLSSRILMISNILREEFSSTEPKELLRDLFFPNDEIPENLKQEFIKNVFIYEEKEGIVIMLSNNILFPLGKTELTLESKMILLSLVEVLQSLPTTYIISAYTDASGSEEKNYTISAQRVLNVLQYFIKRGVPERVFGISAYGETKPMEGYSNVVPKMERRVEILIRRR